jgi:hypothetical protein
MFATLPSLQLNWLSFGAHLYSNDHLAVIIGDAACSSWNIFGRHRSNSEKRLERLFHQRLGDMLDRSSHIRPLLIVESNAITVYMASELLEEVMSLAPHLCTVR